MVQEGWLGGAPQPRRDDLPQAAGFSEGGAERAQGDQSDDGATLDDQAAGTGSRAAPVSRLRPGDVRSNGAQGVTVRSQRRSKLAADNKATICAAGLP